MIKISASLIKKIISFTFWGILTTALNVGLYYGFRLLSTPVLLATVLAWFLCVLFAFITNKKYVFNSKTVTKKAILRECVLFLRLSPLFRPYGCGDNVLVSRDIALKRDFFKGYR